MYDYVLGLYEKAFPDEMPLEEKFLAAAELGYDFLELCVDLNPARSARLDWPRERREALRRFLADRGLRMYTLSLSVLRRAPLGELDGEKNRQAFQLLEQGLELAADLGARVVLINGYDVYDGPSTEETRARYRENLRKAAALAAKWGVVLGVENAEKEVMASISQVRDYVEPVNCPFLQIYGDVGNAANAAEGDAERAMADLESGRGHLAAFHLKDTLPGDYRFVRYGEGHADFARSAAKVKDLGVRIFTAELFLQDKFDCMEEARRVCRFLRGYMDS